MKVAVTSRNVNKLHGAHSNQSTSRDALNDVKLKNHSAILWKKDPWEKESKREEQAYEGNQEFKLQMPDA